jgi:ubiquinone/menaquinone biosynthesis C-methylase UbiE
MLTPRLFRLIAAIGFTLGIVLASALPARGQTDADDAARLIRALDLGPGRSVAEIGAGSGALTVAVARAVGPDGRVYSNELNPRQRRATERAVAAAALTNVTVVEGHARRPNLPDACCDAIFMRDVFHHFDDAAEMSRHLRTSLVPGGRLAVLDFPPRNGHGITPDVVRDTLERAGFEQVRVDESGARWFLVVAVAPDSVPKQ